ncbi:MAG: hypothetical protein Q8P18_34325 [Pseudomonadota bacterium]|nr:hypothetical protein [Pseudomonadota bacterium]
MKPLVELAASRPFVAWFLGYTPFLVLIWALVTALSGWREALAVAGVNALFAAIPVGCVWGASLLLARSGASRTWWRGRLVALALGLVLFFALALGAMLYFDVALATGSGTLLITTLTTLANVVPLAMGIGLEAAARHRLRVAA